MPKGYNPTKKDAGNQQYPEHSHEKSQPKDERGCRTPILAGPNAYLRARRVDQDGLCDTDPHPAGSSDCHDNPERNPMTATFLSVTHPVLCTSWIP